ncbi:unnamed protein product [Effrenium voratum]|uniref:Uncharacterized protein n=1 Tax=Effrenium voratum TaxID=2562239 RepID=A0AA36I1G6_9DINO|nr:unnamed protein product [Effrenium voratum]
MAEESDSGFRTPESVREDWADEAQRLIRQHRQSCDLEAVRAVQKPHRLKRPFETLETAFQVTCQAGDDCFALPAGASVDAALALLLEGLRKAEG